MRRSTPAAADRPPALVMGGQQPCDDLSRARLHWISTSTMASAAAVRVTGSSRKPSSGLGIDGGERRARWAAGGRACLLLPAWWASLHPLPIDLNSDDLRPPCLLGSRHSHVPRRALIGASSSFTGFANHPEVGQPISARRSGPGARASVSVSRQSAPRRQVGRPWAALRCQALGCQALRHPARSGARNVPSTSGGGSSAAGVGAPRSSASHGSKSQASWQKAQSA